MILSAAYILCGAMIRLVLYRINYRLGFYAWIPAAIAGVIYFVGNTDNAKPVYPFLAGFLIAGLLFPKRTPKDGEKAE